MIRKTIQVGDLRLKKKNKVIKNFNSSALKKLIRNLTDSMNKVGLIGIAAPQIGENYSIFVTHPRNTKSRRLGKVDKLRVYINPKITYKSNKENVIYEGCGSVVNGDLFGPVKRSEEIEVVAFDQKGKKFSIRCNGILARVIQHEYDHLMGIEFMEKVSNYRKIIVGDFYRENIRNSKVQKQNSLITRFEINHF